MDSNKVAPGIILATKKLVELYFGIAMVTDLREATVNLATPPRQLMQADPRRIAYEIIMGNRSGTNFTAFSVGTPRAFESGFPQTYFLAPGQTIIVERNFFTDLDSVTLELQATNADGNGMVTVRETFLTPLPVGD